jgi:DNA-binding transcriptional regulator YiaG
MTPSDLRAARGLRGWTQSEMASFLEVTTRAIQMWEAGNRAIPGPAKVAIRLMTEYHHQERSGSRNRSPPKSAD